MTKVGKSLELSFLIVLKTNCLICNLFAQKVLMMYNEVDLDLDKFGGQR